MSLDTYLRETDFYFPAFEGRPYTSQFAAELLQLTTLYSLFWERIQNAKDIVLNLYYHGEVSLPKWDFRIGETKFEEFPDNTVIRLTLVNGTIAIHNDVHTPKMFDNLLNFKAFLSHIFPYVKSIKIDGVTLEY